MTCIMHSWVQNIKYEHVKSTSSEVMVNNVFQIFASDAYILVIWG